MKMARRRVPLEPVLQRVGRVAGPHQGTVIFHPLGPILQQVDHVGQVFV